MGVGINGLDGMRNVVIGSEQPRKHAGSKAPWWASEPVSWVRVGVRIRVRVRVRIRVRVRFMGVGIDGVRAL